MANVWNMSFPSSGKDFYDSISKVLPNGNVLVAQVYSGGTVIFNYTSNTWSTGRISPGAPIKMKRVGSNSRTTASSPSNHCGTNSERYIPSLNMSVN